MKKLILLALLLSACQPFGGEDEVDCSPDYTYPISMTQEWDAIEFQLPWCWSMDESTAGQLMLKDGDSENFVQMSTTELEVVEGPTVEIIQNAPDGTLLYIYASDFEGSQTQLILDSIEWVEPVSDLGALDIPASSCEAPDSTYPQSTSQEWNNISFSLPYCWGATQKTFATSDELWLTRGTPLDGDSETQIAFRRPMVESEMSAEEISQMEDLGTILFGMNQAYEGAWYYFAGSDEVLPLYVIRASNPYVDMAIFSTQMDNSEIQLILNSLVISE